MQLRKLSTLALGQSGDTIVEVLIAVAVCGLALGGAYVAVNHALTGVENQQEHNQAIKLVESQVEDLRSYADSSVYSSSTVLTCFVYDASAETFEPTTATGLPQGSNPCIIQNDGTRATANSEPAYNISITSQTVSGTVTYVTYTVSAQWQNLEGTTSQISMEFRPQ